jgi:hypothetical protein
MTFQLPLQGCSIFFIFVFKKKIYTVLERFLWLFLLRNVRKGPLCDGKHQKLEIGNRIANPCYLKEQPPIILGRYDNWHWTSQAGPEVVFLVLDMTGSCGYNLAPWNGSHPSNFY